jgi:polysaccharide pyruvyl transferase WcaK-like protein
MAAHATFSAPDVHGLVDEVAACEVVVAMRYHAGIAALLGGRPAALLGYSPKVSSLAGDVPGGMVAVRWDRGTVETLPDAVEGVLGQHRLVVEARAQLRARERVNDQVLDDLLEAARVR